MESKKEAEIHLEEHFLIKKLKKDGDGGVTGIAGYVGRAERPDHVRIYQDLRFDTYVEVPKEGILDTSEIPEDEIQFGGTRLWVAFDSELIVKKGKEEPETLSAKQYFKGELADKFIDLTKDLKDDGELKRDLLLAGSSAAICFFTCMVVGPGEFC